MTPEELFNQYYARLCVFAKRLLCENDRAADVVQDVFAQLCEHPERLPKAMDEAKRYLYACVRNGCLKSLRHEKAAIRYLDAQDTEHAEEPKVIEAMIHAEMVGELHAAIATLPKKCAEILKKGIFDGMPNQKIAEELNLSIHTVKSQKQRAIMLLRNRLSPEIYSSIIALILSN